MTTHNAAASERATVRRLTYADAARRYSVNLRYWRLVVGR